MQSSSSVTMSMSQDSVVGDDGRRHTVVDSHTDASNENMPNALTTVAETEEELRDAVVRAMVWRWRTELRRVAAEAEGRLETMAHRRRAAEAQVAAWERWWQEVDLEAEAAAWR